MATPTVTLIYPADQDTGIPVGATMRIEFDNVVDLQSVKDSVILHGQDFDFVTGVGATQFQGEDALPDNYLKSPGMRGVAPIVVELKYYDTVLGDYVTPSDADLLDEASTAAANLVTHAFIDLDPAHNVSLAANTEYTLTVVGDPQSLGTGVTTRTIYAPQVVTNTGSGNIHLDGSYTGPLSDVVHVKITRAGDINDARYKYWYASVGEGSAITGRVVSARNRTLEQGIRVRFSGEDFQVDDEWSFVIQPKQFLPTSFQSVFSTNDGTYSEAPESPSTPAPSVPPVDAFPGFEFGDGLDGLTVVSMTPTNGSYNNDGVREIIITFSEDIDPASVTTDTVKLKTYPVTGISGCSPDPQDFVYVAEVSGNVLTLRF